MFSFAREIQTQDHNALDKSRRGFLGRFAIGAALSIAIPQSVLAANKSDSHHKAAHLAKSAVRLSKPKILHTRHVKHPTSRVISPAAHSSPQHYRALAFQNQHTGDKLNLTYFENGRYLNDALDEISFLLRDHRSGDVHAIDPELLDQLHEVKQLLGLRQPFDIVCGYRSPMTNAILHSENAGVANNSFHIHGRAIDIRIERFDLRRLHKAALAMRRGGVGYYPESNFIHLDTGTFRNWTL